MLKISRRKMLSAALMVLMITSILTLFPLPSWKPSVEEINDIKQQSLESIDMVTAGGFDYEVGQGIGIGGQYDIFFTKKTSTGTVLADLINLSENEGDSKHPKIAVFGENVYVVWQDDTHMSLDIPQNKEIFYRDSKDGGFNWGVIRNLSSDARDSPPPRFTALVGDRLYVKWNYSDVPIPAEPHALVPNVLHRMRSVDRGIDSETFALSADILDPSTKGPKPLTPLHKRHHEVDIGTHQWVYDETAEKFVGLKWRSDGSGTVYTVQSGLVTGDFDDMSGDVIFYPTDYIDDNGAIISEPIDFGNPINEEWDLKNSDGTSVLPVERTLEFPDPLGNTVEATKRYGTGDSALTIKYIIQEGQSLKHEITFPSTGGPFTLEQIWTLKATEFITMTDEDARSIQDCPCEIINDLGSYTLKAVAFMRNLDPVVTEMLDSESVFPSVMSVKVEKDVDFDETDDVIVTFKYGPFDNSQVFDPSTLTTQMNRKYGQIASQQTGAGNDACPDTGIGGTPTATSTSLTLTNLYLRIPNTGAVNNCIRAWIEWNISAIPGSVTDVTDVKLKLIINPNGNGLNCDVRMFARGSDPYGLTGDSLYRAVLAGNALLSNTDWCKNTSGSSVTVEKDITGPSPTSDDEIFCRRVSAPAPASCIRSPDSQISWFAVGFHMIRGGPAVIGELNFDVSTINDKIAGIGANTTVLTVSYAP